MLRFDVARGNYYMAYIPRPESQPGPCLRTYKQRKVACDAWNGTSGPEERGHQHHDMEPSGKKRMGGFDVHAMVGTGSEG